MKKNKKINIMGKDRTVLNMCSKTGHFNADQAYRLNKTTEQRLNKLTDGGFLIKHATKDGFVYTLDKNGKALCTDIYHTAGYNHDLKMTEEYLKFKNEYDFKTGYSFCKERDIDYRNSPDMVLVHKVTGEVKTIEVITPNYKDIEIQQKLEFAEIHNVEIQLVYANKY